MKSASGFEGAPDSHPGGMPVLADTATQQVDTPRESVPAANPYGPFYEEPKSGFDLLKIWGLFLKHRWLVLSIVGIALGIGYGITFLSTPIYRASMTIEIDREAQKVIDLNDKTEAVTIGDMQFYQTQYELLRSRSLAERVVADLDLANQPTFLGTTVVSPWGKLRQIAFGGGGAGNTADFEARNRQAISRVQAGLSVQPIPNSALVRLGFENPSSSWAQKIVAAYADSFIKTNLEHHFGATTYARDFLQDQITELKLKLEQSERDLIAYAQKQQIIALDGKQSVLPAADLMAINTELSRVRTERIQNEQLWQQAQSTDGLSLPQIITDPSIQALRAKRTELQIDYQDKLNTFKPDFPDMQKLEAQIKETDRQIAAAVAVIKQSIKARYEASKQQEEALAQQLGQNTTNVLDVQGRNIEYTILQREVDTNRSLYDALLQRYKDVGVDAGVGTNNVSVVDPPQPGPQVSPNLQKNMTFALALGVIAASLVVYLLELSDDTFKTPEDVEESLQIPVLGLTPLLKGAGVEEALSDPHSHISESFRSVRTALQFSTDNGVPKTLLITSSHPGEGKSTTALAVARTFAQLSLKVLLIDADLRKPSLHKLLECDNNVGLSNYLVGGEATATGNIFQPTTTPGLVFMASGPLPPNPAELLSGPRLRSLLSLGEEKFDLIIIDGPPVVGLADALLLGSVAAGTLMIVGACETPKNVVKRALNRLHFARARMIGAMLSKFDAQKVGFEYGYGYGYGYSNYYYYSYGADKPKLAASAEDLA